MAASGNFGSPICAKNNRVLPLCVINDYAKYEVNQWFDFDFIECFTTTFLRAHSWLNRVDEDDDEHDEVGLKEKPEDTRYIKKITSK